MGKRRRRSGWRARSPSWRWPSGYDARQESEPSPTLPLPALRLFQASRATPAPSCPPSPVALAFPFPSVFFLFIFSATFRTVQYRFLISFREYFHQCIFRIQYMSLRNNIFKTSFDGSLSQRFLNFLSFRFFKMDLFS